MSSKKVNNIYYIIVLFWTNFFFKIGMYYSAQLIKAKSRIALKFKNRIGSFWDLLNKPQFAEVYFPLGDAVDALLVNTVAVERFWISGFVT